MGWWILIPIIGILAVFGPAILIPLTQNRHKFLLEIKREETRLAELRTKQQELQTKELEITQRRAELEYREALLELEKFDRRSGLPGRPIPPELYPPEAPRPPGLPPAEPPPSSPEPPERG